VTSRLLVIALLVGVLAPCAAATAPALREPVVVAVLDEVGGVNVLHQDFRTADGYAPRYPAGMPRPVLVPLPLSGSFADARRSVEAGPLGHMAPGTLYAVTGTRLLLVNAGSTPYDGVQADAVHATGVADSVTGTRYGTDPGALVVVVLAERPDLGYAWLARNPWVDLASTSDYTIRTLDDPQQCTGADEIRRFTRSGHLLFSSAGNTTDQPEPLIAPNGLPETYLVGGVDSSGATWHPGHSEESDPWYAAGNVVRPYETGERFSYTAAAPDSFTGSTHFGGTSGATPLTAGWAARLVAHARAVLGNSRGTTAAGLAVGPHRPARGPLADGRLTNAELRELLHSVAVQHSGLPSGAAYAAEGYGALGEASLAVAERVLDGSAAQPSRAADDEAQAKALQVRSLVFSRCG